MPASPAGGRRTSADYRPSIKKAQGHVPACLVNASVTYCNNDRIYAFGGFDQYTDEGRNISVCFRIALMTFSLQPRAQVRPGNFAVGTGR
jgi:hypothetical protein